MNMNGLGHGCQDITIFNSFKYLDEFFIIQFAMRVRSMSLWTVVGFFMGRYMIAKLETPYMTFI